MRSIKTETKKRKSGKSPHIFISSYHSHTNPYICYTPRDNSILSETITHFFRSLSFSDDKKTKEHESFNTKRAHTFSLFFVFFFFFVCVVFSTGWFIFLLFFRVRVCRLFNSIEIETERNIFVCGFFSYSLCASFVSWMRLIFSRLLFCVWVKRYSLCNLRC